MLRVLMLRELLMLRERQSAGGERSRRTARSRSTICCLVRRAPSGASASSCTTRRKSSRSFSSAPGSRRQGTMYHGSCAAKRVSHGWEAEPRRQAERRRALPLSGREAHWDLRRQLRHRGGRWSAKWCVEWWSGTTVQIDANGGPKTASKSFAEGNRSINRSITLMYVPYCNITCECTTCTCDSHDMSGTCTCITYVQSPLPKL